MVPTAMSVAGPPAPLPLPTIDHFQCYRTKRAKGQPRFDRISVTVTDELESVTHTLVRPYRLCMPTSKNGEDPTAPAHPAVLMCYRSKAGPRFGTLDAQIANQFGRDDIRLIHRRELCVPSTMQ